MKLYHNLLIVTGLVPLIGLVSRPPDPTLLIYSIFVVVYLGVCHAGLRVQMSIPMSFVLAGFLTETLAWTSSWLALDPNPALLHPQLIYDLLLSIGFYGGAGFAWLLVLRRWRFSLVEGFCLMGVYGVLVEQNGAVLRAGLAQLPAGALIWLYVFVVYGSVAGLAFVLSGANRRGAERGLARFPVALILIAALVIAGFAFWSLAWTAFGIVPDPQPIWLRPLW